MRAEGVETGNGGSAADRAEKLSEPKGGSRTVAKRKTDRSRDTAGSVKDIELSLKKNYTLPEGAMRENLRLMRTSVVREKNRGGDRTTAEVRGGTLAKTPAPMMPPKLCRSGIPRRRGWKGYEGHSWDR